jgi:hypothetical protein
MIKFFMNRGYDPLVMDTDGVNFSSPSDVHERKYIGRGLNWKVVGGKEYTGAAADIAEYNDLFMKGEMALDNDGVWPSCINLARKNYALMTDKGKIKLVGNTIKSKKLPLYIEAFLDKGIKMLLMGEGQQFVEWYYEYLEKIFNKQIPLKQIASRARVKISVEDYKVRCGQKTKSGSMMSRQAHMELVIHDGIAANLGDVIFYVNNGTRASHGDVVKKVDSLVINAYRLDNEELEKNPDMLGEYNIARAMATFNKRIEPLMVVFKDDVRDSLIINDPSKREFFTKEQCQLINGHPFDDTDQDKLVDVLTVSEQEMKFWERVSISPDYIYDLAEEGWEKKLFQFETV